jgi:hypothetical protein
LCGRQSIHKQDVKIDKRQLNDTNGTLFQVPIFVTR